MDQGYGCDGRFINILIAYIQHCPISTSFTSPRGMTDIDVAIATTYLAYRITRGFPAITLYLAVHAHRKLHVAWKSSVGASVPGEEEETKSLR